MAEFEFFFKFRLKTKVQPLNLIKIKVELYFETIKDMMKIPIIIEIMARIITFVIEIKLKFIRPIKYSLENINKQNEAPLKNKKKSFNQINLYPGAQTV